MRVLIIGASGFIGRHLMRRLSETRRHEVFATYRSRAPMDDGNSWRRVELTDAAGLEQVFQSARPDVVVHLAAIADLRTAERDPETATAVNVTATSSIARLSDLHRAKLVFVSTEYVFGGERGYYQEDDTPSPTTHYGRTKWQAEQEVAKLAARWNIMRTSIVYGWPALGQRNFVPWLIESLQSGHPYQGSTDVYRTPIFVGHLTDGIAALVEGDYPGIHHVAGRDWVSMYDFATAIADAFDLDRKLVVPVEAASEALSGAVGQNAAGAVRSLDALGLDCTKTMATLGLDHPGLAEGIAAMQAGAKVV